MRYEFVGLLLAPYFLRTVAFFALFFFLVKLAAECAVGDVLGWALSVLERLGGGG